MRHPKYRPDIDGLRAVAILAVVGYHAFPSAVSGGFIGVDIFFVISGFLISSIIFDSLETNNFSFSGFYARRIRRLFPALVLVLGACWLFGWYVLLPDEFIQLGKHLAAGIGFISNFILLNEVGYFDNAAETKPLLHLWSLGIEEQFYIFWPLLLGLVWRSNVNFLLVTLLIAIVSFLVNISFSLPYPSPSAFYSPFSRFWELMVGGLLAYIVLHKKHWLAMSQMHDNLRAISGCLLIALAITMIGREDVFPGWLALMPTAGTFLLISSPAAWLNRKILSRPAIIFIGLISYPLYLWHWVLLSYSNILGYTGIKPRLIAVGLSLMLAWITYEFLEKPTRERDKTYSLYTLITIALVLLGIGALTYSGVIPPRNNTPGIVKAADAVSDWDYPAGFNPGHIEKIPVFIKNGTKDKVLFIGDSHIEQYAPGIVKLIDSDPANTKTAIFATSGGCPPIPNVYEDHLPECSADFRGTIIRYALSNDIESVVIGASWSNLIKKQKSEAGQHRYYYLLNGEKKYFDNEGIPYALQQLETLLGSISKHKPVYLVIDNPNGPEYDPKTFFSGTRLTGISDNTVYFRKYGIAQRKLRDLMIKMADRAGAMVIDPVNHFCIDNLCRTTLDDGTPIYKDAGHIRPFYVKEHIKFMDITVKY